MPFKSKAHRAKMKKDNPKKYRKWVKKYGTRIGGRSRSTRTK